MSVAVKADLSELEGMFGEARLDQAWAVVAERVMQDSNRYVPVRTGALHDSAQVDTGSKSVTWQGNDSKSYAGYVYNMDSVVSPRNPEGRPQWAEYAKSLHIDDWTQVARGCFE